MPEIRFAGAEIRTPYSHISALVFFDAAHKVCTSRNEKVAS